MSGGRRQARRAAPPGRASALQAGALAAALLVAPGCGGASEPAAEETAGRSAAAVQAGSCGGLALAAAAELLGCTEVRIASAVEDGPALHCVMSCSDDPQQGLAYSVHTLPDADVAEAVLAGMRRAVARTGPVGELSGLGYSAWAAEGTVPRLAARAGTTIVEVTQPPDPELHRRAATVILDAQ